VTTSMTDDEIRAMLDANLARAWEIHGRAEARKAAEMAAEANAPRTVALLTPDDPTGPAKPRVGPAMKRVLVYLVQQDEPVTCAAVYCRPTLADGDRPAGSRCGPASAPDWSTSTGRGSTATR
jgi:hypothetical protein